MIYKMFSACNAGSQMTSEICCVSIEAILGVVGVEEESVRGEREMCCNECQLKNQVSDVNLAICLVILKFNITTYWLFKSVT